jgi:hypothetical protein
MPDRPSIRTRIRADAIRFDGCDGYMVQMYTELAIDNINSVSFVLRMPIPARMEGAEF